MSQVKMLALESEKQEFACRVIAVAVCLGQAV